MIARTIQLLAIFALYACVPHTGLSDQERSAVADSVRATLNNYYSDIRREGLMAEFRYLDSSAQFFWVPPGYDTPISYDSVASILRLNAPLYKSIDNAFDTLHVIPLTAGLASYTGKLRSTMTDTTGRVSSFSLVETGIVIRRKDGWKLLNGQTSLTEN